MEGDVAVMRASRCPSCGIEIKKTQVRRSFRCPGCGVWLHVDIYHAGHPVVLAASVLSMFPAAVITYLAGFPGWAIIVCTGGLPLVIGALGGLIEALFVTAKLGIGANPQGRASLSVVPRGWRRAKLCV